MYINGLRNFTSIAIIRLVETNDSTQLTVLQSYDEKEIEDTIRLKALPADQFYSTPSRECVYRMVALAFIRCQMPLRYYERSSVWPTFSGGRP